MSVSDSQPNAETELATATAHLIGLYIDRNKLKQEAETNHYTPLPLMPEVIFTDFSQAPTWWPAIQSVVTRVLQPAIEHVEWELDVMILLAKFAIAVEKLDEICAKEVGDAQQWKEKYPLLDLDAALRGAATFDAQQRKAVAEKVGASVMRLESIVAVLEQMSRV